MNPFGIAIHGGAGTILPHLLTPEKEAAYIAALSKAIVIGQSILSKGGKSLDAVEEAVISLENCPLFNAGKGAVFNADGEHEMDAAIMSGIDRACGAVAAVQGIQNPISLAKAVMQKTEHILLIGKGAEAFALTQGFEKKEADFFFDKYRYDQWLQAKAEDSIQLDHGSEKKFGTVGAVALDKFGNLAAATSTGGMTNKKFGRVGDTPIIGAGTYASNETCAISCTGHGEFFMKQIVAYDVACLMEYAGLSLDKACEKVVNKKLKQVGGEGGLIAIDVAGNISLSFNSAGMYRASAKNDDPISVKIFE
jgi:beta-aspartyl-peptidase (threonine type)